MTGDKETKKTEVSVSCYRIPSFENLRLLRLEVPSWALLNSCKPSKLPSSCIHPPASFP